MAKLKFNNKLRPVSNDPMDWISVEGEEAKPTVTYLGSKPSRQPNMKRVKKALEISRGAQEKDKEGK
jgi:hypothetical protein